MIGKQLFCSTFQTWLELVKKYHLEKKIDLHLRDYFFNSIIFEMKIKFWVPRAMHFTTSSLTLISHRLSFPSEFNQLSVCSRMHEKRNKRMSASVTLAKWLSPGALTIRLYSTSLWYLWLKHLARFTLRHRSL